MVKGGETQRERALAHAEAYIQWKRRHPMYGLNDQSTGGATKPEPGIRFSQSELKAWVYGCLFENLKKPKRRPYWHEVW